ncbi:MAG: 50S ribosomal protein L4 [Thermoleophilia bacterium]|nr:50S ribosomal protein L4 [Thermoleophilia bacterium]
MSKLAVLNAEGVTVGISELSEDLAGQEIKTHLIHETVIAELAARRAGTHSTETRSDVAGGGAKPWRQKGTGRARQGSIRAPQWVGGGLVFGPTPRSHGGKVNRKARRQAFRSALRAHAERGSAALMDPVEWDAPSTKRAVEYLRQAADVLDARPLTIVLEDPDGIVARSFRNLAGVTVLAAGALATVDIMQARCLLVERAVWERLTGGEGAVETVEGKKKRKPRRKAPPEPKDAVAESTEEVAVEEEEPPAEAEEGISDEADEPEASGAAEAAEADVADDESTADAAEAGDAGDEEDDADATEGAATEEDES